MNGLLIYGAALNEGREMFSSDEQFGQWLRDQQLAGDHVWEDQAAAIWASGNLSEYREFGQWLCSSNLDKDTHPGDQQAAMWVKGNLPDTEQKERGSTQRRP